MNKETKTADFLIDALIDDTSHIAIHNEGLLKYVATDYIKILEDNKRLRAALKNLMDGSEERSHHRHAKFGSAYGELTDEEKKASLVLQRSDLTLLEIGGGE